MDFVKQLPYVPNLAGIPTQTTPDWDALKSPNGNQATDYALLRRMQYLRPAAIEAVRARGYSTVIEFVIVTDHSTPEQAVKVSQSVLAYQYYDRLVATIIDTSKESLYNYLRTTESDWVWIIQAGDLIAPYSALIAADWINQDPTLRLFYTDEEVYRDGQASHPFHKPDINIEWLRATPYVGKGVLFSVDAFKGLADFQNFAYQALVSYEVTFRILEHYGVNAIGHIPDTLYRTGLMHEEWVGLPMIDVQASMVASQHLSRLGQRHSMMPGLSPGVHQIRYFHDTKPKVSIIIPIRGMVASVTRLFNFLLKNTVYDNIEIVAMHLPSQDLGVASYLQAVATNNEKIKLVTYYESFNYAAILNKGVENATGEYLCFIHPDHLPQGNDWLTALMGYAQQTDVAFVGSKIIFTDGSLQHGGVVMGLQGVANHPFYKIGKEEQSRQRMLRTARDVTAVTASGTIVNRRLFDKLGMFDAASFPFQYTDADICCRAVTAGYRNIWSPHVVMTTEDSAKKIMDDAHESIRNQSNANSIEMMRRRHKELIANDPSYSPHYSLTESMPKIESRTSVMWSPFDRPALPRIVTLPGDRSGCGLYRTRGPLDAMMAAGMVEGMSSEWMLPLPEVTRIKADTLILQRKTTDIQIQFLREYKKYLPKVFKIYELDDPLHLIPEKSIHYGKFPPDILQRQVDGIQACDRFVVSTEPLAEVFSQYHKNIVVRNNLLPVPTWKHLVGRKVESDLPRVGWGGGTSHQGDLELISDVVKHFHGKVRWVFFGMVPDMLRPYVAEFHSGVPIDVYPAMMASLGLDLAVAPLENNRFNQCKSNLRVLEYGACGYPVVASAVTPYITGMPGVVNVGDDKDDWIGAIEEMLSDRTRLRERGTALRETIHQNWMLDGERLKNWFECWTPD
ncbi:MAG TPA: glycosyltransferase [Dongiaceae bacterium]|nr:glycosyltransferase [Dongiaceae bacterium]